MKALVRPARGTPADAFVGFADWQETFRNAAPLAQPALIAAGVRLAEARQRCLAELPASGGTGPSAAGSPVAATPFLVDTVRVLFLRVDFSDKPGEPVSVANLQASLATTNLQHYS